MSDDNPFSRGCAWVQGEYVPIADASQADEVFITSTAGGVMPVTMIDGEPLGDGAPGSITMQLRQAYWDAHDDPRWTTPIAY